MIRVTIELVPHGMEAGAQKLSVIEIANISMGTKDLGNYAWRLFNLHDTPIPPNSILGGAVRSWTDGEVPSYPLVQCGQNLVHARRYPVETLVRAVLERKATA